MAVVVEQTVPFPLDTLGLENPSRWNSLFPLLRPTVKPVQTSKGRDVLVDQALASAGGNVHVVAVGTSGKFSSKLLDQRKVTAVVTEQTGSDAVTADDIRQVLQASGVSLDRGVVVVRAGRKWRVEEHGSDVVEVETEGEVSLDHVLHLLGAATEMARTSIHHTAELLKVFVKGVSTAHSKFHTEKAEGNPAVLHAEGPAGFEKAKHAVSRDLKHAMKAQAAQSGSVVYSAHYSDVNGLSRLENYILAKEIAEHFEASNVPYSLSHSTVLDHKQAARGWSISISPVPSQYLTPQSKPKAHQQTKSQDTTSSQNSALSNPHMSFADAEVRKRIQAGCHAVIEQEPTITEYDTIVGDGDCGYTLRDGAKQVLKFIEGKDLAKLPETISALVHDLEVNMGGTSGALYCIYLTALAGTLATENTIPKALEAALAQLLKYTRARLGDRTMMDALIPFTDTLVGSGDVKQALSRAREGVEGTKKMEAKLGRSTYLDESATQGIPDPGAYGLLVLLKGLAEV